MACFTCSMFCGLTLAKADNWKLSSVCAFQSLTISSSIPLIGVWIRWVVTTPKRVVLNRNRIGEIHRDIEVFCPDHYTMQRAGDRTVTQFVILKHSPVRNSTTPIDCGWGWG